MRSYELVCLPSSLVEHFSLRPFVNADTVSLPVTKLPLIALTVRI